MNSVFYLKPVVSEKQIYYIAPVKSGKRVYYVTPVGSPIDEGNVWKIHGIYGFSAVDMYDVNTSQWSHFPGDYSDLIGFAQLPESAVVARIVPLAGAQCFSDTSSIWTVTIEFKTQIQYRRYSTNDLVGTKNTKSAAEEDWIEMEPITLSLGTDKKLVWSGLDFPLHDNTGDNAFFIVYYREAA